MKTSSDTALDTGVGAEHNSGRRRPGPVGAHVTTGVQIRDNDPRVSFVRVLTVLRVEGDDVVAETSSGRQQRIALRRIHADGKARQTGFDVLPTVV